MKQKSFLTILTAVSIIIPLLSSGCNHESRQPTDGNRNITGIIHIHYVKSYENLSELAYDADAIVIGTTLYIKQWGLRMPNPDNPAIRVWRVGKITTKTVENLFCYLDSIGFNDLKKHTQPLDPSTQSGVSSDLYAAIYVSYGDIDNAVLTEGYFTPESDNPYKKLPYPIDEFYTKLITIAEEETKEAYHEETERDIVREDTNDSN